MRLVLRLFGLCMMFVGVASAHDANASKPIFESLVRLNHSPILGSYLRSLSKSEFLNWFAVIMIFLGIGVVYANRKSKAKM